MHLVLTLPDLLALDPESGARVPHLRRLIAAAGAPALERDGLDATLAAAYGITRSADWPLAAIRIGAFGIDPGAAYWLRADPVTLEVGRDDVRLVGAVRDLGADDAAALVATLNAHFADDGIAFAAPQPDAWFVRSARPAALTTRPLAAVAGQTLRDRLPGGPDAARWRRWQNEIQMLLHEHPVNVARERAAQAPANSVWFSEGGALPARPARQATIRTFARGGIAAALALFANEPARAVPPALDALVAGASPGDTLVVALEPPLDLDAVERAWAAPAWSTLACGGLETVALIADGGGAAAAAWTARRPGVARRLALRMSTPGLDALVAAARTAA